MVGADEDSCAARALQELVKGRVVLIGALRRLQISEPDLMRGGELLEWNRAVPPAEIDAADRIGLGTFEDFELRMMEHRAPRRLRQVSILLNGDVRRGWRGLGRLGGRRRAVGHCDMRCLVCPAARNCCFRGRRRGAFAPMGRSAFGGMSNACGGGSLILVRSLAVDAGSVWS